MISILACWLSAVTTRGLARNSASASSLSARNGERQLGSRQDGELTAEGTQTLGGVTQKILRRKTGGGGEFFRWQRAGIRPLDWDSICMC